MHGCARARTVSPRCTHSRGASVVCCATQGCLIRPHGGSDAAWTYRDVVSTGRIRGTPLPSPVTCSTTTPPTLKSQRAQRGDDASAAQHSSPPRPPAGPRRRGALPSAPTRWLTALGPPPAAAQGRVRADYSGGALIAARRQPPLPLPEPRIPKSR